MKSELTIDPLANKYWVKYIKLDNGSLKGVFDREDGPAIEWADGAKDWFINDKRLACKTQEEFERLMKLKAFW